MASMAGAALSMGARGAASRVAGEANKINWEEFNWPSTCEPMNVLHLDLSELKEKRGEEKAFAAKLLYRWWQLAMAALLLNCACGEDGRAVVVGPIR